MPDLVALWKQTYTALADERSQTLLEVWLGAMTTVVLYHNHTYPAGSQVRVALIRDNEATELLRCATESEGIEFFLKYCKDCQAQGMENVWLGDTFVLEDYLEAIGEDHLKAQRC